MFIREGKRVKAITLHSVSLGKKKEGKTWLRTNSERDAGRESQGEGDNKEEIACTAITTQGLGEEGPGCLR